jgi:hypothetical protein
VTRWLVFLVACGSSSTPPPAKPIESKQPVRVEPVKPTSAIPMTTAPCDDFDQEPLPELVTEHWHPPHFKEGALDVRPLLCWGEDCVWTGAPSKRPAPRPVVIEHQHEIGGPTVGTTPVAMIKDGKACTGDRCDALGPNLQAAIANNAVQVTSDREAVVVGSTVWSRAKDRELPFPPATRSEGDVETVTVLGNRIAYGRGCNEYCDETGRMLDSRGRLVSTKTFTMGGANGVDVAPIDLAGDRFLIVSSFGFVTLIEKGVPVSSLHVGPEGNNLGEAPISSRIKAVALDDERVAMEACTPVGCQLAEVRVDQWDRGPNRPATSHLSYHVQLQLPRCNPLREN